MAEFDFEKAREFLRKKEEKHEKIKSELFDEAWNDFYRIVDMIIKKYKPEKIYQWGSLLNKKHFSEISDIDIAVQGIGNVGKFFAMFGEADIMTKFDLDLLDIDKIDSIHAESIKKNGRIVYERI